MPVVSLQIRSRGPVELPSLLALGQLEGQPGHFLQGVGDACWHGSRRRAGAGTTGLVGDSSLALLGLQDFLPAALDRSPCLGDLGGFRGAAKLARARRRRAAAMAAGAAAVAAAAVAAPLAAAAVAASCLAAAAALGSLLCLLRGSGRPALCGTALAASSALSLRWLLSGAAGSVVGFASIFGVLFCQVRLEGGSGSFGRRPGPSSIHRHARGRGRRCPIVVGGAGRAARSGGLGNIVLLLLRLLRRLLVWRQFGERRGINGVGDPRVLSGVGGAAGAA